ncbi:MAG: glycosyltransferase family 2 protein [Caulobacteraceae bacterium]
MTNLRITLVTPCLNAAATIERTLESVRSQAYPNLEYLVLDGGSKDETLAIVRRYGDIVTRVVSEKDKNIADALNKGFRAATGDVFGYINADDTLAPGALAFVDAFLRENQDVDVFTGACRRVFADGSEATTAPPADFRDVMAMRNCLEQPSTFWRAVAHRTAGEFDQSYALAFDWDYWNKLYASGARFATTERLLSTYYFTDNNLTSRGGHRVIDEMARITRTYAPNGRALARAYRFIFNVYDMSGYYDVPFWKLPKLKQVALSAGLAVLYAMHGRRAINAYNWNWASKQIRGQTWYR